MMTKLSAFSVALAVCVGVVAKAEAAAAQVVRQCGACNSALLWHVMLRCVKMLNHIVLLDVKMS